MIDPVSQIIVGYAFYWLFSGSENTPQTLKEKFESKFNAHISSLSEINTKLSGVINRNVSTFTKSEAEQYYKIFEECALIAHKATIDFSEIFDTISEEIKYLDNKIAASVEPQKSLYIGQIRPLYQMSKLQIKNVKTSKSLRDKLNKDVLILRKILRKSN